MCSGADIQNPEETKDQSWGWSNRAIPNQKLGLQEDFLYNLAKDVEGKWFLALEKNQSFVGVEICETYVSPMEGRVPSFTSGALKMFPWGDLEVRYISIYGLETWHDWEIWRLPVQLFRQERHCWDWPGGGGWFPLLGSKPYQSNSLQGWVGGKQHHSALQYHEGIERASWCHFWIFKWKRNHNIKIH